MADEIKQGLTATKTITIDRDRTVGFMGEDVRVYGTPFMLADVEQACHDLIQELLDNGQNSVGTRADIEHLAPTMEGAEVEISVRVDGVEGPRVSFSFMVRDQLDSLGRGRHMRNIVEVDRIRDRVEKKVADLASK